MEVLEAADGPSGLDVARRERPDVILLDVMMPGLDGWRVAEELLDDPATVGDPDRLPHGACRAPRPRPGARPRRPRLRDEAVQPGGARDARARAARPRRPRRAGRGAPREAVRAARAARRGRAASAPARSARGGSPRGDDVRRRRAATRRALGRARGTRSPREHRLDHRQQPRLRRGDVPHRADEEEERRDRAEAGSSRAAAPRAGGGRRRGLPRSETVRPREAEGEAPPRLRQRPEERRRRRTRSRGGRPGRGGGRARSPSRR